MNVLVIDNYDSFTYNLVQYFGELGEEVRVFRNDEITLEGIAELRQSAGRAVGDGLGRILLAVALVPRLQVDEGDAGILPLAGEGEAADGEHAVDVRAFGLHEIIAGVIERLVGARKRRARRLGDQCEHRADVLVGHEAGRQAPEQQRHYRDYGRIKKRGAPSPAGNITLAYPRPPSHVPRPERRVMLRADMRIRRG